MWRERVAPPGQKRRRGCLLFALCLMFPSVSSFSTTPLPRAAARPVRGRGYTLASAASAPAASSTGAASVVEEDTKKGEERERLKKELLAACDEWKAQQARLWKLERELQDEEDAAEEEGKGKEKGKEKEDEGKKKAKKSIGERLDGLVSAESVSAQSITLSGAGNRTIEIAHELIKLNPTPQPMLGWKGYKGVKPEECKLYGDWKLRFTTGKDATFNPNKGRKKGEEPKKGSIVTSQEVRPDKGTLVNVIDFRQLEGKLDLLKVVTKGKALDDQRMELKFCRVRVVRRSSNPLLPRSFVVPLPTLLISWLARRKQKEINKEQGTDVDGGAQFTVKYLDDDMRMHQTGEGNWFIQTKIPTVSEEEK